MGIVDYTLACLQSMRRPPEPQRTQCEWPEDREGASLGTGLRPWMGATALEVLHVDGKTLVLPLGEEGTPSSAYSYDGLWSVEDVVEWYISAEFA